MQEGEQPWDMSAECDPLRYGAWSTRGYTKVMNAIQCNASRALLSNRTHLILSTHAQSMHSGFYEYLLQQISNSRPSSYTHEHTGQGSGNIFAKQCNFVWCIRKPPCGYTAQHSKAQHSPAQHSTTQNSTTQHITAYHTR